jgi:hypothetical protein
MEAKKDMWDESVIILSGWNIAIHPTNHQETISEIVSANHSSLLPPKPTSA